MKKKEIMSRLFKGGSKGSNDDLLEQIANLWEAKPHILHVGFRNNPDGKGQKLTYGFTKESGAELDENSALDFPLEGTLQVRYTRTENIVKAPNNRVAVAKYSNMFRDELKEVVDVLTQVMANKPQEVEDLFTKGGDVKVSDILATQE